LKATEIKTKNLIIAADKRAQRNPSMAASASREARMFAGELARVRKQTQRLAATKAQLESVGMQVELAFNMQKVQGTLNSSVGIMQDVNTLIKIPQLHAVAQALGKELMTAGLIEEMTDEILPDDDIEIFDEEADTVLNEVLKGRTEKTGVDSIPSVPVAQEPVEEFDESAFEREDAMYRERLEALRS
jgi:charged multivesicular body protein 3